jgi:hypothetical protein
MAGGKYCSKRECNLITQEMFCKCCGMQLTGSPAKRPYREKVRAKKKLIAII